VKRLIRHFCLVFLVLFLCSASPARVAAPEGTMTWGVHITLASAGSIPPRRRDHHAVHGALRPPRRAREADARRGPTRRASPESWTQSKDGLTYEFVLRKGVKFHNGDPVTAEDVKFSFDRYRGAGATYFLERSSRFRCRGP